MNRPLFIWIVLILSGCIKAPEPPNCARLPDGFYPWRDMPVGIVGYSGNSIRVTNKTIFWNEVDLTAGESLPTIAILDQYLNQASQMQPVPLAAITFERGVSCARITAVRALMEKHLLCRTFEKKCFQGVPPGGLA
jgi:hypothetical protein